MVQKLESRISSNPSLALQQRVSKRLSHGWLPSACYPALNRYPESTLAAAGNSFPEVTPRERSQEGLGPSPSKPQSERKR